MIGYEEGEVSGFAFVSPKDKKGRYKYIITDSPLFSETKKYCYKVFDNKVVFTVPTIDNVEAEYKSHISSDSKGTHRICIICPWLVLGKTYNLFTSEDEERGEDEITLFLDEKTRYDER